MNHSLVLRRSETLLRRLLSRPHAHINLITSLKIEEKGGINFSLMNMDWGQQAVEKFQETVKRHRGTDNTPTAVYIVVGGPCLPTVLKKSLVDTRRLRRKRSRSPQRKRLCWPLLDTTGNSRAAHWYTRKLILFYFRNDCFFNKQLFVLQVGRETMTTVWSILDICCKKMQTTCIN